MLSQIGNTLGTSVDSENYVRGTQNMFRPDVEADDIEGQRQLMNWQTKLGRTDEARNTLLGINTLEEKQKEEKTRREGQARAAGVAEYQKALKAGDDDAIAAAEDAMYRIGEVQGIDVTNLLSGVEQRAYAASDQEYQEKERLRLADERGKAEKTKQNAEAYAVAMNSATTLDQVEALRRGATPDLAGIAGDLANAAEGRIVRKQERSLAEADLKAPMQTTNLTLPKGLTTSVSNNFKDEAKAIDKDIEQLNRDIESGVIINPNSAKQELRRRRNNLEVRVGQASDGILIRRDQEARKQELEIEKQILDFELAKRAPLEQGGIQNMANAIAGRDDEGRQIPPTQDDILSARIALRAARTNDINEQIKLLRGDIEEEPYAVLEIGTVKEGKRYIGGNPGDPASWEDVKSTEPSVPDYVRYDREKVESIRGKITPLNSGKYTYNGGTQ
jgi:hypothetical protein